MTVWLHDYHAAAVRLINNRMFACACMLVLCCWRAMVLRVVLILQDKRTNCCATHIIAIACSESLCWSIACKIVLVLYRAVICCSICRAWCCMLSKHVEIYRHCMRMLLKNEMAALSYSSVWKVGV